MNKYVYWRLAIQSLKKNYRITLPFLGGSILVAAMLFSMKSLALTSAESVYRGSQRMGMILELGVPVFQLFGCLFFLYLNGVMTRNKRHENGLLSVLGLDQAHLLLILFYQYLIDFSLTVLIGIPMGMVAEKLVSQIALRFLDQPAVLGFRFQPGALLFTIEMVGMYYLLILAISAFSILKTSTIDLVHSKSEPQKPIKSRWLLTAIGLGCLGYGYYLALTTESEVYLMGWFLVAVVMVILGTYLLFLCGTSTLLNTLQQNKTYYYKPNHFISLSLMKYRLKTNAASLANIAILSCVILVALSTSVSMLCLMGQDLNQSYPSMAKIQLQMFSSNPSAVDSLASGIEQAMKDCLKANGVDAKNWAITIPVTGFRTDKNQFLWLMDEKQYEKRFGKPLNLREDELYVLEANGITSSTLVANDQAFQLVKAAPDSLDLKSYANLITSSPCLLGVVNSLDALGSEEFITLIQADFDSAQLEGNLDAVMNLERTLESDLNHRVRQVQGFSQVVPQTTIVSVTDRQNESERDRAMYSGLLFIGLYISLLFVLFVILIMYYKQISEGLEDRQRFQIMKTVGLEEKQVRKVINDQVLTMFFLPLSIAALHMVFAYPIISRMLNLIFSSSSDLIAIVMICTFLVFALIYVVIYKLTAKTYFKLTCIQ
ncbi:ABC transporter permease [Erysipelotrichaceae bacterium RD49]|nr:ABC transporter permease [Erysipelotrichaceae bacterium RD49]